MYVVANGAFSMDAKNVELTETKMRVRELQLKEQTSDNENQTKIKPGRKRKKMTRTYESTNEQLT